jgi:hypothetical protein
MRLWIALPAKIGEGLAEWAVARESNYQQPLVSFRTFGSPPNAVPIKPLKAESNPWDEGFNRCSVEQSGDCFVQFVQKVNPRFTRRTPRWWI